MSGPPPVWVQLFSGGLDSLCLWLLAREHGPAPLPVYVRIGAPYEAAEYAVLGRLAGVVPGFVPQVVDGPQIAGAPDAVSGHIPHRNAVLAVTVAAHYPHAREILCGALLGEASGDKSRRFHRAVSATLTADAGHRVRLLAPAGRWTKTELLRRTLAAEPQAREWLALTTSCYSPAGSVRRGDGPRAEIGCDRCPACFRRAVAEYHNGMRSRPPRLPDGASTRSGWAAARAAGVTRWPGLLVNNATAALALAGVRMHGRG